MNSFEEIYMFKYRFFFNYFFDFFTAHAKFDIPDG